MNSTTSIDELPVSDLQDPEKTYQCKDIQEYKEKRLQYIETSVVA